MFSAGAGASGAVFGIAGALIVLLKSDRLPVAFRAETAPQIRHLFCRAESRHGPRDQPGQHVLTPD